jgi:flagellar hook assembly protein FlgD
VTGVRNYLDAQRAAGYLTPAQTAFSPDGDGQFDIAYANLALMRNAKAVAVLVKDSGGNVVKTLGPDYELFEMLTSDGNGTQQIAATYGTKYLRDMGWDGTNASGQPVPDGDYTFEVRAVAEHAFLDDLGFPSTDAAVLAYLTSSGNPSVQSQSFALAVDRVAPSLSVSATSNASEIRVQASDPSSLQAVAVYADGALLPVVSPVTNPTLTSGTSFDQTFDLPAGTDLASISVQAIDFAGNVASSGEIVTVPALAALVETVTAAQGDYTSSSWVPVAAALTSAGTVLASNAVTNAAAYVTAYDNLLAAFGAADRRGDTGAFEAAVAAAKASVGPAYSYTPASYGAYTAALAAAEAFLASDLSNATQADVDAAKTAFITAHLGLAPVTDPPDRTALAASLAAANAAVAGPAAYTPASLAVLRAAITFGQGVHDAATSTQAQLNGASDNLQTALTGLVPAGDGAALAALAGSAAASLVESDYTVATWARLTAAISAAQAAAADPNISAATVTARTQDLLDAIAALAPAVDVSVLTAAIAVALSVDTSAYTTASTAALSAAVASGQAVAAAPSATQSEVNAAAANVVAALGGLVLAPVEPVEVPGPVVTVTAPGETVTLPGATVTVSSSGSPSGSVSPPAGDGGGSPVFAGEPVLPGELTPGASLVAPAAADGVVVTGYQWYRNAVPIKGATSAEYPIGGADLNAGITLVVDAVVGGVPVRLSALSVHVPKARPAVVGKAVKSSARAGKRLKVSVSVSVPGIKAPTGTVTARLYDAKGKKVVTKAFFLKKARAGKVTVTLPKKLAKGSYIVSVGVKATPKFTGLVNPARGKVTKANSARTFKVTVK